MLGKLLRPAGKFLPFLIFLITGIVFLPVINWLLHQTINHDQLLHAFLVMLMTGGLLIYERRISLSFEWQFTDTVQNLLICSYALMVLAVFSHHSLIVLASFCLSLGSFLWFMWGGKQRRFIISGLLAFSFFSTIAVFLPLLDWPLRTIAGKWAALGLRMAGQSVELNLISSGEGPMLMLINNSQPFHVAAECNGFGMLGSSLLMATFILFYRKFPLIDRMIWLMISLLVGLTLNIVRIIVIVLIAGLIPGKLYYLMHESVGILTTYGGLLMIYFLLMSGPLKQKEKPVDTTIPEESRSGSGK